MATTSLLHRGRARLEEALARVGLLHTLSLARLRLHRGLEAAIANHARGRCLDAGSGRSPYREMLAARATEVVSVDVEDRSGRVDLIADVQEMPQVESGTFDTVLCTQVIEHVPRPWDALAELARVLAPGGTLVLTAPHLSVVHEAPHDFYRYTKYGLASLCERSGLEVVEVSPTGGLLTFLGHGASAALMSTLGVVPLLRWPVWLVNYALLVQLLGVFDRVV